jgi:protoheme IX farnesyltransferase
VNRVSAPALPRSLAAFGDLLSLGKPRITFMVLCTTLAGLWLAPVGVSGAVIATTLVGVGLAVAGANALNMYLERDIDSLMERTRHRPLPAGRLQPEIALAFGLTLSAIAIPLLTFGVHPLTGLLAAIALVTYVLAYTPLKRRTTAALLVGAMPGAMPPLIGWTAASGRLEAPGLALFLILYLWQIPHFIAISLFCADDYRRAGLKVIPVEHGVSGAKQRIILYTALLVAASLEPVRLGVAGLGYCVMALILGGGFLGLALRGLGGRAAVDRWARSLFLYSLVYLPLLLAALIASRVRS